MPESKSYNLCVFNDPMECEDCSLKNQIDCHFDLKKLIRFILSFFLIVSVGSIGLIFNRLFFEFIIFLIILSVFSIIFFEFWEIRILCSHCPFYAEERRTLHCYGNYGSLKVWKYHPEPMSKSEKVQLLIGFVFLFTIVNIPTIILLLNQFYIWSIFPLLTFILFLFVIRKYHCAYCNNFSCPLNSIPKEIIDAFLKKNPVMRDAWEKNGWIINNR